MKQILFIVLIFMATRLLSQSQPTLKYFSAQQQTELKTYVTWWSKTEAKKAADSVGNLVRAEYKKALNDMAIQLRKELKDSMAALLPASSVVGRIDSTVKAFNGYKGSNDAAVKGVQDAGKTTDAKVTDVKSWIDKNFKF